MATALSELTSAPTDPDAQAVVTDFSDYTEFFPSDLLRSLTLISKFDDNYEQDAAKIHVLTKTYGHLPSISADQRPDPRKLRADISDTLDHAVRCRESTYAEAERICTVAEHLYDRLQSITRKLSTLTKPPSRDPTPEPLPPARSPKKKLNERNRQSVLPDVKAGTRSTNVPKHRSHRIIVPGEVLPPFDPASTDAVTEEETEHEQPSSPPLVLEREKTPKIPKISLPKLPKLPKVPKEPKSSSNMKKKFIRVRPPGVLGTNVHSTVAGISVSNAMATLAPPPADAKPGSKHAPWLKLTEWELNKLRKRMKKNADWVPSDTMVRRELSETGRGMENFTKAKAHSEATGEPLINEEPDDFIRPLVFRRNASNPLTEEANQELENRGMKLNQAKKLKREAMAKEQQSVDVTAAPRAPVAPMLAASSQGNVSTTEATHASTTQHAAASTTHDRVSKPLQKRKREQSPLILSASTIDDSLLDPALLEANVTQPLSKKAKLNHAIKPDVEVANGIASIGAKSAARLKATARGSRDNETGAKVTVNAPDTSSSPLPVTSANANNFKSQNRVISLTLNATAKQKAASAEPQQDRRASDRHTRRASNASLPSITDSPSKTHLEYTNQPTEPSSVQASASRIGRRGGKRADPGLPISNGDEGGAKVSLGKRKAAPGGKKGLTLKLDKTAKDKKDDVVAAAAATTPAFEVEEIDPNEERYCVCGDVSYGTMIACENDACEKEWFHLP